MVELKFMILSALVLIGFPSDSRAQTFDGSSYLCDPEQPHLQSFRDVIGLNEFLARLRNREVIPDMTACTQGWMASQTRIVQVSDPEQAASSLVAFSRAWAARSVEMSGFEARYVNDAELLLQTVFVCDALGATRELCLGAVIRKMPLQFVADSPVFCDFAPAEQQTAFALGAMPESHIRSILPFVCFGPEIGRDTGPKYWFAKISTELFPKRFQ